MANRNVIGITRCTCGALVEMRVTSGKAALVFYKCTGEVDGERACGKDSREGGPSSRRARAEAARLGWLGPIPYGYFPPTTDEGNSYGHNLSKIGDFEQLRTVDPWRLEGVQHGPAAHGVEPAPAPVSEPEPEPVAEPEPAAAAPRAEPKRRGFLR